MTEVEYFCTAPYNGPPASRRSGGTTRPWRSPGRSTNRCCRPRTRRGLARGLARAARIGRLRLPSAGLTPGGGSSRRRYHRLAPRRHPRWQHLIVHKQLASPRRATGRHRGRAGPARLHMLALVSGLAILVLGLVGWIAGGGPGTFEEIIVVADLALGGTILATGSLVGRARALGEPPRRPARGPPARRAADEREPQPRGGRPRRRRGDPAGHRLPQRPRLPARARRTTSCPSRSRARVGAYEKVDLEILRTQASARASRAGCARTGTPLRIDDATQRPARGHDPRHGRRRRVDAGGADAARRQAGRRDHALEARPAPVRRRRPAAADDPRRPGRDGVQRRGQPRRDAAPRGRAAPAAGHEQRPVALPRPPRVADMLAEHLARAVGADACADQRLGPRERTGCARSAASRPRRGPRWTTSTRSRASR